MTDANFDWGGELHISPWKLVGLKTACFDLGLTEKTLLRLAEKYGIPIVKLSTRKRCFLARDLMRLVMAQQKDADAVKVAGHA